jgi:hypothetical protein
MGRSVIALSIFAGFASLGVPSTALAVDKFAWGEVQRQMGQFQTQVTYFDMTTVEPAQRTDNRYDTNQDRPFRAKTLAGGPPKFVSLAKRYMRIEPIKFKFKKAVGGIAMHISSARASASNFGRIFNGPAGTFHFDRLSQGGSPFSFSGVTR